MTTMLFAILFWSCIGLIVYSYVLYPILIVCLSRLIGRDRLVHETEWKSVSLLIVAHNEEQVMDRRIQNALALDYPKDQLKIVVACDGCADGTVEIVRRYADRGVRLIEFTQRRGKAAAINRAIPQLQGEIVLLSDANTDLDPSAARKLVRWFDDSSVGVVCGRLVLHQAHVSHNADDLYWNYETILKQSESRLNALLGANGAIYAMRQSLYQAIPDDTIIDDFVIALRARLHSGCSIVYDVEAIAREETAKDVREEFRRRCRIGAGNFQSISLLWPLLNPMRGFIALSFFSHKILRWICPFLLIGLIVSNLALAREPFYRWTMIAQLLFYTIAVAAMIAPSNLKLPKLLRLAAMFVGMNAALLVGFFRWLFRSSQATWQPTARPNPGEQSA